MNPRWKKRPEGSNWGDFGPDDQLGRLNYLTPEKVKQGVAEVKEGLTFCLSIPLDYPGEAKLNVRRLPPVLAPTFRDGNPYINYPTELIDPQTTTIISDDQVTMCLQYSTQWDSLAHIGSHFDADDDGVPEKVYYNGTLRPATSLRSWAATVAHMATTASARVKLSERVTFITSS